MIVNGKLLRKCNITFNVLIKKIVEASKKIVILIRKSASRNLSTVLLHILLFGVFLF